METVLETRDFVVLRSVVGTLDNNAYLLGSPDEGIAVLIDAADDTDILLDMAGGWEIEAVLTTHGHADHVAAADAFCAATKAPFRLHSDDGFLVERPIDVEIHDREIIKVGPLSIECIHTPGHTPGSTCFRIGSLLFTGDTLFPGGPGATRFPYSSFETIMMSLENRIFTLADETTVLPGHGAATTLGAERSSLQAWRQRGW